MKAIHVLAALVLAMNLTACNKNEAVQQSKSDAAQQAKTAANDASVQSLQEQVAQAKRHVYTDKELEDAANVYRKMGMPESEIQKEMSRLRSR